MGGKACKSLGCDTLNRHQIKHFSQNPLAFLGGALSVQPLRWRKTNMADYHGNLDVHLSSPLTRAHRLAGISKSVIKLHIHQASKEPCFINANAETGQKDRCPSSVYNYHSGCRKRDLRSRQEGEQRQTGAVR